MRHSWRRQVGALLQHAVEVPAALRHVAADAPGEPHVRVGVDEDLHVKAVAQPLVVQRQDALHDDDLRPVDVRVVLGAQSRVRDEIVRRNSHRLVAGALQLVDHFEQMVEVELTEGRGGISR